MKRRRWKRRTTTTALSFDNGHERPLCLTTEGGLSVFPLVFNNLPMPPFQLLPTMTSLSPLSPVSPDYSREILFFPLFPDALSLPINHYYYCPHPAPPNSKSTLEPPKPGRKQYFREIQHLPCKTFNGQQFLPRDKPIVKVHQLPC